MHTFNVSDYQNLLPQIQLSSAEIRSAIAKYKLDFSQERNREVERKTKLPMFVDAFYDFLVSRKAVPEQEPFYQYYLEFNKPFFDSLNRADLESGIKARAYRTYPSLVRDIYFNKYIDERIGAKCKVIYNTKLDIEEGIDLMIVTNRNNYGICFFTKTRRAFRGRVAKENRHTRFDNVEYVEMPMAFKERVKVGDFFLYGEREYTELYNTLKRIWQTTQTK